MSSLELDRARIERLLARAADELDGDWILVGGAAAALWFAPHRTTQDIDLLKEHGTNADTLKLMEIAEAEGLPFEAVNSGAMFVLRKIADWRQGSVLIRAGSSARIYRPSATVFVLSKIGRLGEQDLDDCLALFAWCEAHPEEVIDRLRVSAALAALAPTTDAALAARRQQLATVLASGRS